MWTTLALAATLSLAPQQAGQLTLANPHATYGAPGIARADTNVLPGDHLVIAFDIEGITVDPAGKVQYSTAVDVTDAKGKSIYKQEPRNLETIAALGGTRVPGMVQLDIGLDQQPGDYEVKIAVADREGKRSGSLTQKVRVIAPTFGLVRVTTTADHEARAPIAVFETGGSLWLNAGLVGFERNPSKAQPDVGIELRVLDDAGKPTLAKPFVGEINDKVPPNARFLPVQYLVSLNRPGKFTVELKATDRVSKKTATIALPITVAPSK